MLVEMTEHSGTDRTVHTALCVRSGDWWAVTVPEVPGVFTQARRLDQVATMARDAIALLKGVPADTFDVLVSPQLAPDIDAEVDAARELRETADRYQREATNAARTLAAKLVDQYRLTLRDAARIIGLSHQRVAQLLARPPGAAPRPRS
jgi:predicted RNase H-like HicB family nuclease